MASITQRDDKKWQAKIRKQGFPPQSKTFLRRTDAEAWARKTESEMERSIWRDSSEAERTTLAEALTRYENEVVAHKRGLVQEKSVLAIWRDEKIAKNSLASIRAAELAAIRDRWAEVYAPATIARRFAVLSHVFSVARRDWGLETLSNPVELVSKPQIRNERVRRVSEAEVEAVCNASESTMLPAIVRLAVETAMRRSELVGLRWEHVDLRERTLHLPMTKNGYARDVPLSSVAVATLSALPRHLSGRVFPVRDDTITQAFSRAVERARARYVKTCEEEGRKPDQKYLVDLRLHDLRHEATSRLSDSFQIQELAKITGHRDTRMLLRYYHPKAADLAKRLA